jgi:hypothetical protein
MPALIQHQTDIHPNKPKRAQGISKRKRPRQRRMKRQNGVPHCVKDREEHKHGKMARHEMRFPEQVEQGEMSGSQEQTALVEA